ncbi:ribosome hibernation-promoting factor, HPF/YfiA family [Actinopolymorpha rutila]|uniref:Ribosome hibernation promoting factor n=1 Tax=Actinopolymorpha rutila TaxID=446787 RepID=A0A852ZH75_9ACTN|nr:ribosomal subunit interface protein [Actinopolymorpha rutila]
MDVVVVGRHCAVTDRFRRHVEEKLTRLERFTARASRIEIEVCKERTRAGESERVELTVYSRGPLVRAEASAADRFAALDLALDKLLARLRKAADRRRVHHGSRTPMSVAEATGPAMEQTAAVHELNGRRSGSRSAAEDESDEDYIRYAEPNGVGEADGRSDTEVVAGIEVTGDGPLVVRVKEHAAVPMALDQALYEMELVGHDFYLFIDADSQRPSVVYRRRGYDYGVIRLEEEHAAAAVAAAERRS